MINKISREDIRRVWVRLKILQQRNLDLRLDEYFDEALVQLELIISDIGRDNHAHTPITARKRKLVLAAYKESDTTITQLAIDFGISPSSIWRLAREAGIKRQGSRIATCSK